MSEPAAETAPQGAAPPANDAQAQQRLGAAVAAGQFLDPAQAQTPPAAGSPGSAAAAPQGAQPAAAGSQGTDPDLEAEVAKWKALSRKHETGQLSALGLKSKSELDELRAAAAKYAEIEASQKTELQKATEQAAAVQRELADARAANARLMAADTHSIPPDLIDLLGTGTDEEIAGRAAALAAHLKAAAAPAAPAPQRPVEALTPGAAPASAAPGSPDAWIRRMAGRT
jgi:hypothetical protein